ncbi:MAG: OsmC family protein [Candidatus Latescibacteria bacterium]|nr:OsmC family protein [Candidatus Latescibacterota bacterium]
MPVRNAHAVWEGNLLKGNGKISLENGTFERSYTFRSRFEEGEGTNPEELIGAAHAGCFSMALAHELDQAGFTPQKIKTTANVHLTKAAGGFEISKIELVTEATVPDIEEKLFLEHAENAKKNCPVSKALKSVSIKLKAKLVS